jgi:hypothetical protein
MLPAISPSETTVLVSTESFASVFGPVRHERVAVAWREGGHGRRLWVALVFVEDRQIRLDDLAQDTHAASVQPPLEPAPIV